MQLIHIEFEKLSISASNMRHGKRIPDIADILPSVRQRGILVPLLVRAGDEPDHFEIVAGRRRYFSAKVVREEQGSIEPLPCAVMAPGDDAAALEASILENIARRDPDPMRQYESFVQLVREGRGVTEIAATFGFTEREVKQRLTLGNLLPKIREAYRDGEIGEETIQYLTLATKARQKEWLALLADEEKYAPLGYDLKRWLFGGRPISTGVSLFPLTDYRGEITIDLFGEEGFFADANLFWDHQNAAIAVKQQSYSDAGWKGVEIMERGAAFHSWEYEKTSKKKGGKVFIEVADTGEVVFHEGYLARKEVTRQRAARAGDDGGVAAKAARPEVTGPLQHYIDLHRHAAVRAALSDKGALALRLILAHLITAAGPWQRRFETPLTSNEGTTTSLAASPATRDFETRRGEIMALLSGVGDRESILGFRSDPYDTVRVFHGLLLLTEEDVMRVCALVMAEALLPATPIIEALGVYLKIDMASFWEADSAFFDLNRDQQVLNAMLAEIAGPMVACKYATDTAKRQKEIARNYLDRRNGRPMEERWVPRWLHFPAAHYTDRGGLQAVKFQARITESLSLADAESDTNMLAKA